MFTVILTTVLDKLYIDIYNNVEFINDALCIKKKTRYIHFNGSSRLEYKNYIKSVNHKPVHTLLYQGDIKSSYNFYIQYIKDNNVLQSTNYINEKIYVITKPYKDYTTTLLNSIIEPVNVHIDNYDKFSNKVYLMTFNNRKKNNIYPYMYIGSVSAAEFKNNKLVKSNGSEYWGSATDYNYQIALNEELPEITILGSYKTDVLKKEGEYHRQYNVVANTLFFNKVLAGTTPNSFTETGYNNYRNIYTGIIVRLKIDDPMVLDGTYVSPTTGKIWYTDGSTFLRINPNTEIVPDNWYKGTPSDNKISINNGVKTKFIQSYETIPEGWTRGNCGTRNHYYNNGTITKTFKKDDIIPDGWTRGSLGSKNKLIYNNGYRDIQLKDSSNVPEGFTLGSIHGFMKFYTNGKINKKLLPHQHIPEGFILGRTNKKKGP